MVQPLSIISDIIDPNKWWLALALTITESRPKEIVIVIKLVVNLTNQNNQQKNNF